MPLSKDQRRIKRKAKSAARSSVRQSDELQASDMGVSVAEFRRIMASLKEAKSVTFDATDDLFASSEIEAVDGDSSEFKPVAYSGQAYAGGDIRQPNVPYPIVVNLATARVAKPDGLQALLKDHRSDRPLGQHRAVIMATEMRVEDGMISVPNSHSKEVIAGAKNKFPWQASIRGRWGKISLLKAGDKRRINGRTIEGPRFIADDFVWRETTTTGLGADQDGPELQIAASEGDFSMTFEQWLRKMGLDKSKMSADEIQAAETTFEAINTSSELSSDDADSELEASDSEDEDDSEIAAAATATKKKKKVAAGNAPALDIDEIVASAVEKAVEKTTNQFNTILKKQSVQSTADRVFGDIEGLQEIKASAISEGWDEKRMSDAVKLYKYENNMPNHIRARSQSGDNGPNEAEIFAAAMSIAQGNVTPEQLENDFGVSADVLQEASSSRYRGIGFHGVIRAAAAEAGIPLNYHTAPDEYPRLAMEIQGKYEFMRNSGQIAASQGWSTLNLAAINENVMNRSIHGRFMKQESIIPRIAQVAPARDFRPHKAYRMWGEGFFKKLKATGEIEHLKFSDTGFTNEVDTTAGMITIPRKAIANDDLNIFQQVGDGLADTGWDTRERDFCSVLLSSSLWRTAVGSNGEPINALASGGSSAFGITALEALSDVLAKQKDRGGKPIRKGGSRVLLTQTGAMARQAKVIHNSEHLQDQASGAKSSTQSAKLNPLFGELEQRIESDWLEHSSVPGASSTAFFLFSDPSVQAFIQILYLNNRQTPYVETEQAAFNVLGQQMRSYWDYGIAQIDDLGGAYSPGA
jgi:hypothetical protein